MPIVPVATSTSPGLLTGSKLKEHCFKIGKYHSGLCSGFIMGVYDGALLSEEILAADSRLLCPPEKVEPSQLRKIVVNFLDNQTENLHKDAAELVWESFILAFPCEK